MKKHYHAVPECMIKVLTSLAGTVPSLTLSRSYWPVLYHVLVRHHRLHSLVWSCGHAADLTRILAGKPELCSFSVRGGMHGSASSGRELAVAIAACSRLQQLDLRVLGESESSVSLLVALSEMRSLCLQLRSLTLVLIGAYTFPTSVLQRAVFHQSNVWEVLCEPFYSSHFFIWSSLCVCLQARVILLNLNVQFSWWVLPHVFKGGVCVLCRESSDIISRWKV